VCCLASVVCRFEPNKMNHSENDSEINSMCKKSNKRQLSSSNQEMSVANVDTESHNMRGNKRKQSTLANSHQMSSVDITVFFCLCVCAFASSLVFFFFLGLFSSSW
jgi:hypothetical protein